MAAQQGTTPRAGIRCVFAVLLAGTTAVVTLLPGCGDNWPPVVVAEPFRLVPTTDVALVKPGENARISFLLTTLKGAPVARGRVEFSAIGDPLISGRDLAGATLTASSGLTDDRGTTAVTVTGGLPTIFRLTGRHPQAPLAEVLVVVSEGDQGTISIVATPVAGSTAASVVTSVDVLMLDTLSCSGVSTTSPPRPVRPVRTIPPGTATTFRINNMVSNAIVGQGRDATGQLRAAGCVDLPASTVAAGSAVEIHLPLGDTAIAPGGTYLVTSQISLAKREISRRVAAPWLDLADCPLDPGQLWLDCAIDALGAPPGDALDCLPAAGGEGDLANLILARRGISVAGSACRGATTPAGTQTLEAKVAALFPSPAQPPASTVASLGTIVASLLDHVVLGSTLAVQATASARSHYATHTLRTASFQVGGQPAEVDVLALGAPGAQVRFVPVMTTTDRLAIDSHGVSLQLGRLARVAFANGALVARGLPGGTAAYLELLFGLATTGTGPLRKSGCEALDGLVCAEVGRPAGCLWAACLAGQAALAARLDGAFALLDGDGADLHLSGSAVMADDDGDGVADRLGLSAQEPGLWTAQIRARFGTEIVGSAWTAQRQSP